MNIEQKIDKLEQELNNLKQQAKSCSTKYWKPKDGEKAWYIESGNICSSCQWISSTDKTLITLGDVFQSEEAAEKELKLRLATQRLKEAIWEANGGKFINFSYNVKNTTINRYYNTLQISNWTEIQTNQNWMYIKDQKVAERVLKENHKDFEIYYGLN